MKITRGKISDEQLIIKYLPVDYSDVYVCEFTNNKNITPDDIQVSFWTDMPKWLNNLFKLRNIMVKPFGLKNNEERNLQQFEECIRNGNDYSFASVPDKSPDETVLSLTDKHLTAYISVYIKDLEDNKRTVYITTLVNFHNKLGYMYFYTIYPFHHLVVRNMLGHTIKKLLMVN